GGREAGCELNRSLFEDPVELGFVISMGIGPPSPIRNPGIVTMMLVAVTELGIRIAVPKLTYAPCSKPVPVIVNVKVAEFAGTLAGDSAVIEGEPTVLAACTLNESTDEMPPP